MQAVISMSFITESKQVDLHALELNSLEDLLFFIPVAC